MSQGNDNFQAALAGYGWENCSFGGDCLLIGLGADAEYKRSSVTQIPLGTERISFLAAPLQVDLITSFSASALSRQIKGGMIGTSHDYAERKLGDYDFVAAIKAFLRGSYPALSELWLGDMEQLFNGHRYFGKLGEVSRVFDLAPALQSLSLHGHAALSQPVSHDKLKNLSWEVDDIGISGGPISQRTLDNVLASRFAQLEHLELALDDGGADCVYDISQRALAEIQMPKLKGAWIDCLSPEAQNRFAAWKTERFQ